jgi:preprotein translocase subunit Sec63
MILSRHLPRRVAHYLHSHPDKVKLTGNDTAESVATRFVEITKAYKAYAVATRPELTQSDLVPALLM